MWQWVTSDVSRQSSCVFELTGLEAQDQDIKGKPEIVMVKTETMTRTINTKTKTVKILSPDETVSQDFPSLRNST